MSDVVHLKWGEQPTQDSHLMVRRISRSRGDDFFVRPCDQLRVNSEPRSFASLASALLAAEAAAEQYGVDVIYVRMGG